MLPVNSICDALSSYEASIDKGVCNRPLPSYIEQEANEDEQVNKSNDDDIDEPHLVDISMRRSGLLRFPSNVATMSPSTKLLLSKTHLFENALSKIDQIKIKPHLSSKRVPSDILDTCYHLIKLYCDAEHPLADVVAPLSHTSNQLDYSLSWHLIEALLSLNYSQVSQSSVASLHDGYAIQLQTLGLWHWSIFVLMHIDDAKRRESCVRSYLSRHVSSDSELNEQESFLVDKLGVPVEWLYEYKALRAKYEHQHENQFKLLVKAHKWSEAHLVLIEMIAPDLFIKGFDYAAFILLFTIK
jgi:hypothetical protein